MSEEKMHTFGVRIDDETFKKLERLAVATERSKGAIVRLLIRQAAVSGFREVCLLPNEQQGV